MIAGPSRPLAADLAHRGRQIADHTRQAAFVRQMADGTLPEQTFLWYLTQNALFLTRYAEALRATLQAGGPAVASALASDLAASISGLAIERHAEEYRARSGRRLDLAVARPSPVGEAYAQHLQAAGADGQAALLCAVLPGEQSYAAAGHYYRAEADLTSANPYVDWVSQYLSGHVDELVSAIVAALATCAASEPPSWADALVQGWYQPSVALDEQFWAMVAQPVPV